MAQNAISESKVVLKYLEDQLIASNSKTSLNTLIKIFLSSSEVNQDICYCLAASISYLNNKHTSFCKVQKDFKNRNKIFTAKSYVSPNQDILKEINSKLSFTSKAVDLFLDVPIYKFQTKQLI